MNQWMGPEEISTIATLESHLHCPKCTTDVLADGFSGAYWLADATIYFCWCQHCGWLGEITELSRVVGIEAVNSVDLAPNGRPNLSVV